MAIKIAFDKAGNPELPTLILAKRDGAKIGQLKGEGIHISDSLNDASEIQFEMHKYLDDGVTLTPFYNEVKNFRLLWCREWDMWFEITVDVDEDTETFKTIYCSQLGQAELSQINLYNIEINTEDDIARDDYEIPTVLYNPEHPEASLLNRMMEHAPHYYINHVDSTIANIQRTFSFNNESIYDGFREIEEEIECIFIYDSNSDKNGDINRSISVYDLDSNCNVCGHRGDFTGACPECGSTNITEGYGNDTTIFITAEELAKEIQFGTDTNEVKNCFKLEGGDDLMTATIRNCNPNGSDRIWYITSGAREDMSEELQERLIEYDDMYEYYQTDYVIENVPEDMIEAYNELVTKYREYNEDLEYIPLKIVGYPALMEAYYNTIDFALYLQSVLMPDASLMDTNAEKEAAKLTPEEFGVIAVSNTGTLSTSSANNAVQAMAKVIVDARYQVKVNEGELDWMTWTGNFKVTNYSDEDDTAISEIISLEITDDYEEYLRQMIEKEINSDVVNDYSIEALFEIEDIDEFSAELKKYCLDSLNMFWDIGQACLDILIEQGVADKETWGRDVAGDESNLYEKLYLPYYEKQAAIEAELKVREDEINLILGTYDEDGFVDEIGMQIYLYNERCEIQSALDFESFMGEDLWLEFSAFRREDTYNNSNFISDGLDNAELFSRAMEFLELANKEIYKSAELQHSIDASLRNLMTIKRFAPLVQYFECGNWLRILSDGDVYKLRLIQFEIDYDSLDTLSVDFSDVMKTLDGISDKQSVIAQAASMATSYDYVAHQASQGSKSYTVTDGWSTSGLDVDNVKLVQTANNETQSWDSHGMLFRRYDDVTASFYSEQLRIIHSTMAITDDNWETVKTAVGGFYYTDPETGDLKYAYGINGEVLIGKLILGENLGIYNESGTLKFDANGLQVYNDVNKFVVNPNDKELIQLWQLDEDGNEKEEIFYVDDEGLLYARNATIEGTVTTTTGLYTTELRGGRIRFYYDGDAFGQIFASQNTDNHDIKGINIAANYAATYIAFGHQSDPDSDLYNVYYQIAFDDKVNSYPETHHFYSTAGFSNTIYPYSNITFENNGYGVRFTNANDEITDGMFLSSSNNLFLGSVTGNNNIILRTGAPEYRVLQYLGASNSWRVPVYYWATVNITVSAANTSTGYTVEFPNEFPSTPQCVATLGGVFSGAPASINLTVNDVSTTGATIYIISALTATFNIHFLAVG